MFSFTLSQFLNVVKGFLKSPLEVPQSRTILVNVNGQTHILQVSL